MYQKKLELGNHID